MAFDSEKIIAYLKQAKQIEKVLEQHQDLFDYGKFSEFQSATVALEEKLQKAQQDSRKLSIGIVGAVKAGKSSFLNACIFGGKEYLPKAATPMTAALTKISYSETPRAAVHFYKRKDWNQILENSRKYDAALEEAYKKYEKEYDEKIQQMAREGIVNRRETCLTREEYERKKFRCNSDILKSAKELTRMVQDSTLENRLGSVAVLEGDVIQKLQDYVGAQGRFTPIVNYVELQLNLPELEDLEIVDTPGLNDPVVSRGYATRRFLRSCDVAVLLSPCSQFMDANTVGMIANVLPEQSIKKAIVVGSKLDSGVLNEPQDNFLSAMKRSLDSYKMQFRNSMNQAMRTCSRRAENLEMIGEGDLLFVSSICFSIAQKMKQGHTLNAEETLVLNNLRKFPGFEDKYLSSLGGIKAVHKALDTVRQQKAEIIQAGNDSLLDDACRNHLRVLDKIQQELAFSLSALETSTAEDLQQRKADIDKAINSSRSRLRDIFEGAAIDCKNKANELRPQLTQAMENHRDFNIEAFSHEERKSLPSGFLGLNREVYRYTVHDNQADTSGVIHNIEGYASSCQIFINREFQHVFNKERLSQQITEVVLAAFQKTDTVFEERDILGPLQNVLKKLSSPEIQFDYTSYIDKVESQFPNGYAKNEEIPKLKNLQERLFTEINNALNQQLTKAMDDAAQKLYKQAVTFADSIQKLFCGDLDKLQKQVKERETYIAKYQQFAEKIKQIKAQLLQTG